MEVIAKHRGVYPNGTARNPGDQFTLTAERHFSKRWMIPAGTPEAARLADELEARGAADKDRITGERLAAGGMPESMVMTAEQNVHLQAKVAELTEMVEQLKAQLGEKAAEVAVPPPGKQTAETTDVETEVKEPQPRKRRRVKEE